MWCVLAIGAGAVNNKEISKIKNYLK